MRHTRKRSKRTYGGVGSFEKHQRRMMAQTARRKKMASVMKESSKYASSILKPYSGSWEKGIAAITAAPLKATKYLSASARPKR